MHIVFIAGTLGAGGAEKQIYYLSQGLRKQGDMVTVISLAGRGVYGDLLEAEGVHVHCIENIKGRIARLIQIIRIVRKTRPDVIYSFHFYCNTYAALAGMWLRIGSVGSVRSDGFEEKRKNGWFSWLHYSLPGKLVANSEHAINNLKSIFYNRKVFCLENSIDLSSFDFNPRVTANDKLILLFIGRLDENKNPDLFLEAVKQCRDAAIPVQGILVGSGKLLNDCNRRISDEQLPVEMHPFLPDLRPMLYSAHWLISASGSEGTPNVILEAWACGTRTAWIHTNNENSWAAQWVADGLLHQYNSPEDFVRERLMERNDDLLQVKKNRAYVETNHSESHAIEKLKYILSQ